MYINFYILCIFCHKSYTLDCSRMPANESSLRVYFTRSHNVNPPPAPLIHRRVEIFEKNIDGANQNLSCKNKGIPYRTVSIALVSTGFP